MRFGAIALWFLAGASTSTVHAQMRVEYVAHACFVIESPSGARIVLDPFNSNTWLGYCFPEGVEADAVAITHPHYDPNASYYIDGPATVFREPGECVVGDIRLIGVKGESRRRPAIS